MKNKFSIISSAIILVALAVGVQSCQKQPEPVKVSGVSISSTSLTMTEGDTQTLTASVTPSNADNKGISWSTSDATVVTVDNGKVTALKKGTATVTAKSDDGGKTATCTITVNPKVISVESITIDKASASLRVGESVTLTATVKPDDATDKTVAWTSSDDKIATVKDGKVTAVAVGTATITAKAGDKSATCSVIVEPIEVTSVTLDKTSATLKVEESVILTATVKPDDATDKTVAWTSSDDKIATVKDGKVTAVAVGTATITAKAGDKSAECQIMVISPVEPLCFYSNEEQEIRIKNIGRKKFEYSYDNQEWIKWDGSPMIFGIAGKYKIFIRGNNPDGLYGSGNAVKFAFSSEAAVEASGNIMSLLNYSELLYGVGYSKLCYLFDGCEALVSAPDFVFQNDAFVDGWACQYMFRGCKNLKKAPKLTATRIGVGSYCGMFEGCINLVVAPELPATSAADNCYQDMFRGCTSLTSAPKLPALDLGEICYADMFHGCTSLISAPELPATELAYSCYSGMFYGCTSLTSAPELPATALAVNCYDRMFDGCTSLTSAPALPATAIATSCYNRMFEGCTSLTSAPALPATTLANNCYLGMFRGCTSLTSAPELPAKYLEQYCYEEMFKGCSSLSYIKAIFTTCRLTYKIEHPLTYKN